MLRPPEVPAAKHPLVKLVRGAGLCLVATACAAPTTMDTRVVLPSYLLGTLGEQAFDVRSFCRGEPTAFALTTPPRDIALAVVTLGIYTPHELDLQCRPTSTKAGGTAPLAH